MAKKITQGNQPRFKSGMRGLPTQTGRFKVRADAAVGPGGRTGSLGAVKTVSTGGPRIKASFGKQGRADTPGLIS